MRELRCAVEFREDASRLSPGRLTGTLLEYETKARIALNASPRTLSAGPTTASC